MKIKTNWILPSLFLTVTWTALSAQDLADKRLAEKPVDTSIVFFNPKKIPPEQLKTIYQALAELSIKKEAVTSQTIAKGDNLNLILDQKYNLKSNGHKTLTDFMTKFLKATNGIGNDNKIIAGKELVLPKIPIQDTGSYTGAFTQYFDLYNNKSYFSSTASLAAAIPTDPKSRDGKAFNEAKYFAYKLSGNDLDALISKISKPLFDKLYGHAITEVKDNKILEIDDIGAETDTLRTLETNQVKDSSIVAIVSKIPADYFEGYYVLDYFPGSTNHGKKVLDVISERFAQYGLDTIGKRIVPVPINYFQNQPSGLALLKLYYQINSSSYTDPDFENIPGMGLVLALEQLKESKYVDCEKCIPQGYLNVIFKHYYRLNPDLISSSFYVTLEEDVSPIYTQRAKTNLLTAVLNDPGEIENILNASQDTSRRSTAKQPLYNYVQKYPNAPVIMVGNRTGPGQFKGWHSKYGNNVTVLGQGTGWGTSTSTIQPKETGTSFATPDIGAQLYIAKAYWKQQGVPQNPYESRIRLLLATDIEPAFVGKFASGGAVNIKKLLQTGSGYIEKNSGEIVPITYDMGLIGFDDGTSKRLGRSFRVGDALTDASCGIARSGNDFYLFSENALLWHPIKMASIKIKISTGTDTIEINNKELFIENFKQLVLLKNK